MFCLWNPLLSINPVFSIAQVQIEKEKEVSATNVEIGAESSAMAAQRFQRIQTQQKPYFSNLHKRDWKKEKMEKFCNHCKNKGDSVDQCFNLIGYPEWYNTIKVGKKRGMAHIDQQLQQNCCKCSY